VITAEMLADSPPEQEQEHERQPEERTDGPSGERPRTRADRPKTTKGSTGPEVGTPEHEESEAAKKVAESDEPTAALDRDGQGPATGETPGGPERRAATEAEDPAGEPLPQEEMTKTEAMAAVRGAGDGSVRSAGKGTDRVTVYEQAQEGEADQGERRRRRRWPFGKGGPA
jgi:hypothetical protein